ncbi:hypothetical protein EJ06DRAFT_583489 [Trichodelitschia bisporula]|uniref:DUF1996 domain-containing protein n=1 Tax=Trichodelitschia bisporula TaxID=703511 RepID=A0A6G1HS81_9PEZI|nr:hypothetical protein EJ06DRAFT_583489 [Trichodelitschia bisporula]
MSFATTQTSTCSTAFIKPDKSNYWMPSLYFQLPSNGSFKRVPERPEHKIYYFNRAGANETIQEFPTEFRMIAGNSASRSLPKTPGRTSRTRWATTRTQATARRATRACCRIFFIENWLDTKSFDGSYTANDMPWVLAQGDPRGYGFHADFLNGWQEGVLLKAITSCTTGSGGRPLTDCFEVYDDKTRNACAQKPVVDEDIDGWMEHLPGCNPVQKGPADATPQKCSYAYASGAPSATGNQAVKATGA